jgi:hypothetical protein
MYRRRSQDHPRAMLQWERLRRRGHKADELPLTGEFDFIVSSNYDSWVAQPLVLEHH